MDLYRRDHNITLLFTTVIARNTLSRMLKFCYLTQWAVARSPCIIAYGARTLSGLRNTVTTGYGCVNHHENRSVAKPRPSIVTLKEGRRLLTSFPPAETKGSYGDKGGRSDQRTSVDVKTEFFHFHPTCLAETISGVSSSFTVVPDMITEAEEEMLMKEVEPHLKRLKYEFDHWDDVRSFVATSSQDYVC